MTKREAVDRLRDILNEAAALGREAKGLVEEHFPHERARANAYRIFDFGTRTNLYDTTLTLGALVDELEQGKDELDGDIEECPECGAALNDDGDCESDDCLWIA